MYFLGGATKILFFWGGKKNVSEDVLVLIPANLAALRQDAPEKSEPKLLHPSLLKVLHSFDHESSSSQGASGLQAIGNK